jgi:hydroxymethylglutaryl-CoA reductase
MEKTFINSFSKLTKEKKIESLSTILELPSIDRILKSFWHNTNQQLFDNISENTISNYYLPYSIAPNFLINESVFHIPMVTEESSVVAAAAAAAKFWFNNGGFKAEVISMHKTGQVHFKFSGGKQLLLNHWPILKEKFYNSIQSINSNMVKRGGGVLDILLVDYTSLLKDYYQISVTFNTADSMGANFINTSLEQMAVILTGYCNENLPDQADCEVIMSILSNYTPECKVLCSVEAPVTVFNKSGMDISSEEFIEKFIMAIHIAESDIYRCVTHNKGIMNGIDAVLLATGNDFRAVEADAHAYSSRNGKYSSLSCANVQDGIFKFSLEIPINIGTIGGLTSSHPLAALSLEILGNPGAKQLMMIIAAAGLAAHFSSLKALITVGIQKGHMKMHLTNILHQLHATEAEKSEVYKWFMEKTVSFNGVNTFLQNLRDNTTHL